MLKVGLTGGIASGKTTVAKMFASLGAPIIDADKIAHQMTQPNTECYQAIIDHFGQQITKTDKTLNRSLLREIIFKDSVKRKWLEHILHPKIVAAMKNALIQLNHPYCILVIPLLIETELTNFVDRIAVIDLPSDLQIARTEARDKINREQILAMIATQCTQEERLAAANDIIHNDQDMDTLFNQVKILDQQYKQMASDKK